MQGGDAKAYYRTKTLLVVFSNVPGMQTNFGTRFSFPAFGLHFRETLPSEEQVHEMVSTRI